MDKMDNCVANESNESPFEYNDVLTWTSRIGHNWGPVWTLASFRKAFIVTGASLAVFGNALSLFAFRRQYAAGERLFVHQISITINDFLASISGIAYIATTGRYFLNARIGLSPIFCYSPWLQLVQPLPRKLGLMFTLSGQLLMAFVCYDRWTGIQAKMAVRYAFYNHERRALIVILIVYSICGAITFGALRQSFPLVPQNDPFVRQDACPAVTLDRSTIYCWHTLRQSLTEKRWQNKSSFGEGGQHEPLAVINWSWRPTRIDDPTRQKNFILPLYCDQTEISLMADAAIGAALFTTFTLFIIFSIRLAVVYRRETKKTEALVRGANGNNTNTHNQTRMKNIWTTQPSGRGNPQAETQAAQNNERNPATLAKAHSSRNVRSATEVQKQPKRHRPSKRESQAGGGRPVSSKTLTSVLFVNGILALIQLFTLVTNVFVDAVYRPWRPAADTLLTFVLSVQLSTSFWWFAIVSRQFRSHLKTVTGYRAVGRLVDKVRGWFFCKGATDPNIVLSLRD